MTAKTSKQRRRRSPAPLGLHAIFSAMQSDDYRSVFGPTRADAFVDVQNALRSVSQDRHHRDFNRALAAAANRDYPGAGFGPNGKQRASECPDTIALSSFWAGVAACWFYMNAINGKDGAR
jgi:hypothetical protein